MYAHSHIHINSFPRIFIFFSTRTQQVVTLIILLRVMNNIRMCLFIPHCMYLSIAWFWAKRQLAGAACAAAAGRAPGTARATGRVAGPAHRRVAEDRGCRVAGPASRAEAAAGSRYLVLVDKLSQSLQDRCLLLLSLAALATSSMQ